MMRFTALFNLCFLFSLTGLAQDIKTLNIASNDLVYVPAEDRIYISTPSGGSNGNSICVIDPYYGTLEECYFVGSEPNELAIADDGSYLYIGLNGTPEVVKFDLEAKSTELVFTLGSGPFGGQFYAEDIEVLPGQPHSVAIARRNFGLSPKHEGVAIYDDGEMRPATTQDHTGSNSIAFAGGANRLFGYNNETTEFGFRRLMVSASGLVEGNVNEGLISGFGVVMESQGERIYASSGEVVNTAGGSPSLDGTFTLSSSSYRSAVEPAPDSNVVYFVTDDFGSGYTLRSFDKTTYNSLDEYEIPNIDGDLHALINWGADGKLAFNTDESIIIIRNCTPLLIEPLVLETNQGGGCFGESVELTAPDGYDNYIWSNGDTGQSIMVDQAGEYYFFVSDSTGCLSEPSNSVMVEFDFPPFTPFIQGSASVEICQGQSIVLTASGSSSSATYLWSNGATGQSIAVDSSGTFTVAAVSANGCTSGVSTPVTVTLLNDTAPPQPSVEVVGDTTFCFGETTLLVAPDGYSNYQWSTGQATQSIQVAFSGNYSVQVGTPSGCMSTPSEPVGIVVNSAPAQPFIQVNGNVLASSSTVGNQWFLNGEPIPGATGQFYTATESGFYSVQVTIGSCSSPMSALYNHTLVGTAALSGQPEVLLFPNPARSVVHIRHRGHPSKAWPFIEVLDATGAVLHQYANTNQVDLGALPGGLYLLRVFDAKQRLIAAERVLKQ